MDASDLTCRPSGERARAETTPASLLGRCSWSARWWPVADNANAVSTPMYQATAAVRCCIDISILEGPGGLSACSSAERDRSFEAAKRLGGVCQDLTTTVGHPRTASFHGLRGRGSSVRDSDGQSVVRSVWEPSAIGDVRVVIRADEERYTASCETRLCRANGSQSRLIKRALLGSDALRRRGVAGSIVFKSVRANNGMRMYSK